MPKVELVYFKGCPSVHQAKEVLRAAGLSDWIEIDLEQLDSNDPRRKYSSPTLLLDGVIIAGGSSEAQACSLIDWLQVAQTIAETIE